MLHISYRRFCSVQCTAHRERERYLGWYGTAQPQEYSGVGCAVRQAWRARGRATVTLTALSVFGVWRTLDAYKMMPRQTQTTGRAQASAQPRSEHRRARARPAHPASPIRDCSRTVLWHEATRRADGRRHTPHAPTVAPACGVCTLKQPAQACADQHAPHRSRSQGIETCSEQSLHSSPRRPRGLPRPRRPPLCR